MTFKNQINEIYTDTEKISEVTITLAMEGLQLDKSDIQLLQAIKNGNNNIDKAREGILSEV